MNFTQPSLRSSSTQPPKFFSPEKDSLAWVEAVDCETRSEAENGQGFLERLEQSWLASLVKSSPDLVGLISFDGVWLFLNPVGQAQLGWESPGLESAITGDWLNWQQVVLPAVMQQGQWQGEFRFWHSKLEAAIALPSQWFLVRDPNTNQPMGLATVVRSETAAIAVSTEARDQATKGFCDPSNIERMATALHELRSPLTVIASSAGLLESVVLGTRKWLEPAKARKHFQRIQSKVKQMSQLIEDLLLISRSDRGSIPLQPTWIDSQQVCAELVEEAQLTSPNHEIGLRLLESQTPRVCVDEQLFRRIVTNLLTNSIKYSPNGGRIYLDLACSSRGLRLEICDEGIGILAEDQPWLFDSFYRASNVGAVPGSGLGLAIVKQCVDLHRGTILVRSQIGIGTTFVVELPNVGRDS